MKRRRNKILRFFSPNETLFFFLFRFPVGRWLDVGEDDKRISLELEPNKKPTSKVAIGEKKIQCERVIFFFTNPSSLTSLNRRK